MNDKQLRPVWGDENIAKILGAPLRKTVSGGSTAPTAVWCWVDSLTSLSRERVRHVSDTELLHKSRGERTESYESGDEGRRRAWSAEQKARILRLQPPRRPARRRARRRR